MGQHGGQHGRRPSDADDDFERDFGWLAFLLHMMRFGDAGPPQAPSPATEDGSASVAGPPGSGAAATSETSQSITVNIAGSFVINAGDARGGQGTAAALPTVMTESARLHAASPAPAPEPPQPRPAGPAQAAPAAVVPTTAATAPASAVAGDASAGLRFYAVWRCAPGNQSRPGVYLGPHPELWRWIEANICNGSYIQSGARLRRFDSHAEAVTAYTAEAPRHGLSGAPQIFRWPL